MAVPKASLAGALKTLASAALVIFLTPSSVEQQPLLAEHSGAVLTCTLG
jgi:hypothetical protein